MKYILEINGVEFERTHKLGKLIECLPYKIQNDSAIQNIHLHDAEITKWATESRYTDNFCETVRNVQLAITWGEQLIIKATNMTVSGVPAGALKWCRDNAPEPIKKMSDEDVWESMQSAYFMMHKDE